MNLHDFAQWYFANWHGIAIASGVGLCFGLFISGWKAFFGFNAIYIPFIVMLDRLQMNHYLSFQKVKAIMEAPPVPSGANSCGVSVSPYKTECVITPREPQTEDGTRYQTLAEWYADRREIYD